MTSNTITLRLIAGYCPEEAIWKLIADICTFLQSSKVIGQGHSHSSLTGGEAGRGLHLTPDSIWVDGQDFMIDEGREAVAEFLPPEYNIGDSQTTVQQIWTIGALACFASSGRVPFGGYGGKYQQTFCNAPLPVLQKAHQKLTPVVQRCLQYNPERRIGLDELASIAQQELVRCQSQKRIHITPKTTKAIINIENQDNWPEAMIEIG